MLCIDRSLRQFYLGMIDIFFALLRQVNFLLSFIRALCFSLLSFLSILATTTIISEVREMRKNQDEDGEKSNLLRRRVRESSETKSDEGFHEEAYEEGYFSLYICDKRIYEENH